MSANGFRAETVDAGLGEQLHALVHADQPHRRRGADEVLPDAGLRVVGRIHPELIALTEPTPIRLRSSACLAR